ncbi:hypothetical protein B4U80_11820 [Leptotrombidium deliense]|uniref:Terpene synthase n=1 Tax=Leptotrombidium deliense TaxID=299467 RepID=A0A443S279_9ACAR|nr:hypothetical protein B4U80_11820 [Leptotrombidium deliense]
MEYMDLKGRKYQYPKINISVPSRTHVDFDKIKEETFTWAAKFGIASGERKRYEKDNVTLVTCMAYHGGDYERVLLVNKFTVNFFEIEDNIEMISDKRFFFGSLVHHGPEHKDLVALMDSSSEYEQIPLVVSFADVWKDLKAITTKRWQERFAQNYIGYLKSLIWVRKITATQRPPSVAAYVEMRHYTSRIDFCNDFTEVAYKISVPDSVLTNVVIQRVNFLCSSIIGTVYDVYSYEKKRNARLHNLIAVIKHEYKIGDQEAIEKAIAAINEKFEKLQVTLRLLPTFERELNDIVKIYIDGCLSMVTSNIVWGFGTDRYVVPKVLED